MPPTRTLVLNFGHFLDHLFMLLFAKAAFEAGLEFGFGSEFAYAEMIPYGMPAAVLFGAGAPIAATLADRLSRETMLATFFFGVGLSAVAASLTSSPLGLGIALAAIGLFASIYHPVGIAMLVEGGGNVGSRLGVNGVWGNFGVAGAPLLAGLAIANADWRMAFAGPGIASLILGTVYLARLRGRADSSLATAESGDPSADRMGDGWQRSLIAVGLVTLAGGFVFGTITFLIPRLFEVRLMGLSDDSALTGIFAALIFGIASFSQIGVGRLLDRGSAKRVLMTVGAGQPLLLVWMATGTDASLLAAALLAMAFIFGQVPISDVIVARTVPDRLRPRILSLKFLLNLSVGAMTLPLVAWMLKEGGGFEAMWMLLALASIAVVLAAAILPTQPSRLRGSE